ncbi:hypothetical protein MKW92_046392 [Papaver armeniacum]|nr:hypothetical protein MKW92_046392 [Papaver armeniacum]
MNGRLNNSSCRSASALDTDGECPHELLQLFTVSSLNLQYLHIDQPASKERITDDALLHLANRAQGNLRTLSLVKCSRITNDGLKRVLERNPGLNKLNVPGCTRLTVEGILKCLKNFKSRNTPSGGIKQLRVGERYDVQRIHFEELKSLIGEEICTQRSNVKRPRFYGQRYFQPCGDDDCAMDIEVCPRCQFCRMVYDCPSESCLGKTVESQTCRACRFCISRCSQCGRCIDDVKLEETFCLEPLCSDCRYQAKV